MNITVRALKSMSGKQLEEELAHKTGGKEPQPYPGGYLAMVRKEIKRREKRRNK